MTIAGRKRWPGRRSRWPNGRTGSPGREMRTAISPKSCARPAAPTRPPRRSSRRSSATSARRTWAWSLRCGLDSSSLHPLSR